jgi:hypothetical protein
MLIATLTILFGQLDSGTSVVPEIFDAGVAEQVSQISAPDAGVPPMPAVEPDDTFTLLKPEDAPTAFSENPSIAVVSPVAEKQQGFVKGELSVYLGSDRLTVKNTRIGVSAGLDRFGQAFYILVEPLVDLRFLDGALGIGLGVPLRFEIFNFANDPTTGAPLLTKNLGKFRVEDYNSFHDFGRVLKYVTYGRKEDNLFISAGQRYSSSVGHGAITRRYAPNIDIDYPRASAQVDAYNDYGGFELMTNDLLEWNQLSGLAFLKPLSFFKPENLIAKTLSIGVSAGLDWKAPWDLKRDAATGTRILDADGRLSADNRAAALIGFDIEAKVVKTTNIDIKPYIDYTMLLGGDGGLTLGFLGRFNVGEKTISAFRVVAEARYLGNRYQPSFFDTFYEFDRFTYQAKDFRNSGDTFALFLPKQKFVLEKGLGNRFGYYLEGSWGIRDVVGLTLAVEGVSNAPSTNFVAHVELPVFNFLQLFASYYLRGVESFTELGTNPATGTLGLFGDKAVAFAGARLKILPFLFVNGRAYKTFRINPELQRYDNQIGFVADLEIGYEFQKSNIPDPSTSSPTGTGQSRTN